MKIQLSSTSAVKAGFKVLPEKGTKDTPDQVIFKAIKGAKDASKINPATIFSKVTPAAAKKFKEKRVASAYMAFGKQRFALHSAVTALFAEINKINGTRYPSAKALDNLKKIARKPDALVALSPAQINGAMKVAEKLSVKAATRNKVINAHTAISKGGKIAVSLFGLATWYNNTLVKESDKFKVADTKEKEMIKATKSGVAKLVRLVKANPSLGTKAQQKGINALVPAVRAKNADFSKIGDKARSIIAKMKAVSKEDKTALREMKTISKFKPGAVTKPSTTVTTVPKGSRRIGNKVVKDGLRDDSSLRQIGNKNKAKAKPATPKAKPATPKAKPLTPKQDTALDTFVVSFKELDNEAKKAMRTDLGLVGPVSKANLNKKAIALQGAERTKFINGLAKTMKVATAVPAEPKAPKAPKLSVVAKKVLGAVSTDNGDGTFGASFQGIAAAAKFRGVTAKLQSNGFTRLKQTPQGSNWENEFFRVDVVGSAKNFSVKFMPK